MDTPVNDPRLGRRACMPGRSPRPAPAPRADRPAPAGELAHCARGTEARGDRARGRHGPSISKVHTFHRNGRRAAGRRACKARGINVRWCHPRCLLCAAAGAHCVGGTGGQAPAAEDSVEGFLSPGKFLLLIFNKYFPTEHVSSRVVWRCRPSSPAGPGTPDGGDANVLLTGAAADQKHKETEN